MGFKPGDKVRVEINSYLTEEFDDEALARGFKYLTGTVIDTDEYLNAYVVRFDDEWTKEFAECDYGRGINYVHINYVSKA